MKWACWIYVVWRHTCGVEGWFLTLSSGITFWQSLGKQYRMPGTESSSVTCKPNMPYSLYSLTPNMLMLITEFFTKHNSYKQSTSPMHGESMKKILFSNKDRWTFMICNVLDGVKETEKYQHHEILFICCNRKKTDELNQTIYTFRL